MYVGVHLLTYGALSVGMISGLNIGITSFWDCTEPKN